MDFSGLIRSGKIRRSRKRPGFGIRNLEEFGRIWPGH